MLLVLLIILVKYSVAKLVAHYVCMPADARTVCLNARCSQVDG